MPDVTLEELRPLFLQLLGEPAIRSRLGGSFTAERQDQVDRHEQLLATALMDKTLGGSLDGPIRVNGVSIIDGTITAPKLVVTELEAITASTGDLNVTGSITAAASFPATGARVTINSTGLLGYNSGVTNTFKLGTDGSGFVGVGGTAITWTTGGVVTIPVASIGSLTIAAVGGGVFGGTYQTATTGAHINLSTAGIAVYNATSEIAANRTFLLDATTGAMTATGSFTVQSASSGTRVVLSSAGGIEGYNGATQTFLLNASNGAGQLGPTSGSNYISWSSTGVTIGGVALSSGKIVASHLSVATLSSISADVGTITAGTITAATITTGTMNFDRISGGSLGGGVNLGSSDLTVNSTGKIKFGASSADYLSNNILHFEVGSSEESTVEWKNASNTPFGELRGRASSSSAFGAIQTSYNSNLYANASVLSDSTTATAAIAGNVGSVSHEASVIAQGTASSSKVEVYAATTISAVFEETNRRLRLYGRLYPGTGSGAQTTGYINWDSTNSAVEISGAVRFSGAIYMDQTYQLGTDGTGALPNPTKWFSFTNLTSGFVWYVPAYSAKSNWAA